MKKTIICLLFISTSIFATTSKTMETGCKEHKINEVSSIVSCKHGDYNVTLITNREGEVYSAEPAKIVKIGEPKQIIQYITQQKH